VSKGNPKMVDAFLDREDRQEAIMQETDTATERLAALTGTPDEHYDIVSVLYHALKGAAVCAEYLEDAQRAKDQELASFFEAVLEEDRRRAERAKTLLAKRITSAQQRAA
jgi:hypothetical protein